ncbi:peptidoglycan-binding protein [Roseateles violae]|uniref:Peptidoglycan-binding protein n=1 Tax=Roseateles violae TaxID=3058042 RepID=A0ABT8DNU1_9BURK|nr:peptidoglycan-binding protein [Pelomonas sp. PFR6]MDN3920030.1 peptidoglycan-binding protein [Pelomonas sp. PFR6]
MAFVTTFRSPKGNVSRAYNIDFSVGAAADNQPVDVMLVQALMRILYYEIGDPFSPPPGDSGIEVDGLFGPVTMRHIADLQRKIKAGGFAVRLDGVLDPFRAQGQLSTLAKVRYVLEILNDTCFDHCRRRNMPAYKELPSRTDIPTELRGALNQPERSTARKYQR